MGYALFTARKLSLTSRVNQMNAQLMKISQQQQNLTNEISKREQANNLATTSKNRQALSVFQEAVSGLDASGDSSVYNQAFTEAQNTYNSALSQNTVDGMMSDAEIDSLRDQDTMLDLQRETLETQLTAAQQELESVKKAEESAIKSATPAYVG